MDSSIPHQNNALKPLLRVHPHLMIDKILRGMMSPFFADSES